MSLLNIGRSAVLANSTLLNTTSNNIANINTPGYVRQRTEFVSEQFGRRGRSGHHPAAGE